MSDSTTKNKVFLEQWKRKRAGERRGEERE